MPNTIIRTGALALAAILFAGGCAARRSTSTTYHDPDMDFSLLQSVVVMPFANLTTTSKADAKVRDVFMTMLQATGALYVVPPGETARAISRMSVAEATAPTPEEAVALAKNVGADAVITGTVLEYGEVRSGSASANVVSVSVRMQEGETGRVVWSASATRGGVGASERLLGGGGQPMNGVTAEAVEDLLDQLFD